jgi:plasmid maintenance system antidote protein VapI
MTIDAPAEDLGPDAPEAKARETLEQNLRRLLAQQNLTVGGLARSASVADSTIWALLARRHNATLKTLVRLGVALGTSPSDLLRTSNG